MLTPLKLVGPGDAVDTPVEKAAEAKRQATEAKLFRRELAAVLDALGDALIDGDRAKTVVWYGVASRMVEAGGPLTE